MRLAARTGPIAAMLVLATVSAGVHARQALRSPKAAACEHDGEVVRDDRALPPVPRYEIIKTINGPLYTGRLGSACYPGAGSASFDESPGVLPPASGTVVVEARVDARGCVTSVCVLKGLGPEFDAALTTFVQRQWYFYPARLGDREVPTLLTVPIQVTRQPVNSAIAQSTDVAWLESIAGSPDGAALFVREHHVPFGGATHWRIAAFARLGDLGTSEGLAAVRRIEADARTIVPAPSRVRLGLAPAVEWHTADGQLRAVAQIRSPDGLTYSVVVANLVGGLGLFLTSTSDLANPGGWSRPKRIPAAVYRGSRSPSLAWKSPGVLLLRFEQGTPPPRAVMEGTPNPGPTPPSLGPRTLEIIIADVERDSDEDGWTDIEEALLGLDPHNADTDGDGIPDGKDVCPNYAPAPGDAGDESVQIIQKAVFAAFGLTRSMEPIYPSPESRKVQLWGYRAPVIYGHPRPDWSLVPTKGGAPEGYVFVNWTLARKTADAAVVVLSDVEGPLAAGGQEIYLEKKDGEWFVVLRATTWIS